MSHMALADRVHIDFEAAFVAEDPVAAISNATAVEIRSHHADRGEVLAALERQRQELEAAGRTDDEDAVIEVIERVMGYSARNVAI